MASFSWWMWKRRRGHLSSFGACLMCLSNEEISMHVLRNCSWMYSMWNDLIPSMVKSWFFGSFSRIKDWMLRNLCILDPLSDTRSWSEMFAFEIIVIWYYSERGLLDYPLLCMKLKVWQMGFLRYIIN